MKNIFSLLMIAGVGYLGYQAWKKATNPSGCPSGAREWYYNKETKRWETRCVTEDEQKY